MKDLRPILGTDLPTGNVRWLESGNHRAWKETRHPGNARYPGPFACHGSKLPVVLVCLQVVLASGMSLVTVESSPRRKGISMSSLMCRLCEAQLCNIPGVQHLAATSSPNSSAMSALIHALTRSIYNLKLALPSDNIPPPCLVHMSRKWKSGQYPHVQCDKQQQWSSGI